jgi:nucleotide-binding universal stress UspA family protein
MHNVVVGLDGGVASNRALEWAARAVGPHGTVHAVTAVSPVTELVVDAALADSVAFRRRLQIELETEWIEPVRHRVHTITAETTEGSAVEALRSAAVEHGADAIVVGAHVPAHLSPPTIGSTARHLLRDLPCALVVVPHEWRHDRGGRDPIIVGVGHGDATDEAVRWAARLAECHGLGLGLVRATGEGPVFSVDGFLDLVAYYIDPSQREVWTQEDLVRLAHEAQAATDSAISVGVAAVPGLPATNLVEAGIGASLLVIGQHRSLVTGTRHATQPLRYALAHAPCPVAVIPVRPEA